MKITITGLEYFQWGVYGGFGFFTRKLATELTKRGVEVEVLVPKLSNQQKPEQVDWFDGVKVVTTPKIRSMINSPIYKTDCDVIHEQYNPLDTLLSFRANPSAAKVVTIQDMRTYEERKRIGEVTHDDSIHFGFPKGWRVYYQKFILGIEGYNIRSANVVACQAKLLYPKIRSMFGYKGQMTFLPNFIDVPEGPFKKTDKPSVLWLARIDPIKDPLLMFKVAKAVPGVDFYVLGQTTNPNMARLVAEYSDVPNLHFVGHQEGNIKEELLNKSWILINTSVYECLPVSFLEALAHKCAILSTQNPDNYTENYGYYDATATVEGLVSGLKSLIENDNWKAKANEGYSYVKANHATDVCVQQHIDLYRRLIA